VGHHLAGRIIPILVVKIPAWIPWIPKELGEHGTEAGDIESTCY